MTHSLLHGDCLELMKKLPNKSIDLILADLPYGLTRAKWDSVIPLDPLWKQYKRLIKDHGAIVLFGSEPFSSNLRMSNLKMYRYDWVWNKTMPTQFLNAHRRPMARHEMISVFYKHLPTYNPQMGKGKPYSMLSGKATSLYGNFHSEYTFNNKGTRFPVDVIKFKNSNFKKRFHPTQKPVPLLKYLIKTYTNKDDLILDNVMGSGSTGIATELTGRDFIGMEKDNHYFKVASDRISKVKYKQPVTE